MNNQDLGEHQLNRLYEDFQKEQMRLMTEIKNGNETKQERELTKQITMINTININILRLRNLRKQVLEKINM
jgi:hypothetical protein